MGYRRSLLIALLLFTASVSVAAQAPAGFTKIANVTSGVTYVDATCPDTITCYYVVTALDASGHESQPAACATGQTCINGIQAQGIMPNTGTHTVTLTWVASTSTGVSYNVYQHVGPFPASGLSLVVN
jgi:hypothetical protein